MILCRHHFVDLLTREVTKSIPEQEHLTLMSICTNLLQVQVTEIS